VSRIDLDHLRRWIGRSHGDEDVIAARHAQLMAATVDLAVPERIADGAPLPALWHWLYFLDGVPARELGRDGHPARGGFLPPVPLANRMWAGGRVQWLAHLTIGSTVRRTSTVARVEHKRGRSGDLVFVTVRHDLDALDGAPLIREEQDLVYRDPPSPAPSPAPAAESERRAEGDAHDKAAVRASTPPAAERARCVREFTPTSTTLFRYSALTFNGHRIHYDAEYCRDVEGYTNLVVHGPLLATLLAGLAEELLCAPLTDFRYRALAPAFVGATIGLAAEERAGGLDLSASVDGGRVCMLAEART
jgi:3-methylfumaryl-CoA hydratase